MRKRVDIISLKLCRDRSIFYEPRFIKKSFDAYCMIKGLLEDEAKEKFVVIALNIKGEPTAMEICSKGSSEACLVQPKEVFKLAIVSNASKIIVAHNHPSGQVEPSDADIDVTKNLNEVSKILNIPLIDHIIIGEDKYLSFADEGLL